VGAVVAAVATATAADAEAIAAEVAVDADATQQNLKSDFNEGLQADACSPFSLWTVRCLLSETKRVQSSGLQTIA
jgi:hypothetical protein